MIRRPPRSTLFPYRRSSDLGWPYAYVIPRQQRDTVGLATLLGILHRGQVEIRTALHPDRKSTRLNSSHSQISYAVFCLKKKKKSYPTCTNCQDDRDSRLYLE